ncbi:MAG: LysR family transcriptional regulator [Colwellia sp.]|nr:MAG: LysR family transcriptional regulator [Colwellia sp.]
MVEIKHLRTLETLAKAGNIRKTADILFVSQSALSHQLKELEQRLNTPLFIRNTSPVQFTAQGKILLQLAQEVLPKITTAISQLNNGNNIATQLNLAITCHACFQWLLPITQVFSQQYPNLTIEFIEQVFPAQFNNKSETKIDILFTDEKIIDDGFSYHALGKYEVVAVLAKQNNLTNKDFLTATNFSQQVLLTYPVKKEQLDIFKYFLNRDMNKELDNKLTVTKGSCQPKAIKQVANSHMILQMVAADMGIATLPNWLVTSLTKQSLVQTKRIGKYGIYKTLYARYQKNNKLTTVIEQLIPQAATAFSNLTINNMSPRSNR